MTDEIVIEYCPEEGENPWEINEMIQEVMALEGVRGDVLISTPDIIDDFDVSRLPALVINDEVVIEGRPPTPDDLVLWFSNNVSEKDRGPRQNPAHIGWPKSVSEAVHWLIEGLSTDDREWLAMASDDELNSLLSSPGGLGQAIRNGYGLWGGNNQLLEDCGTEDADDASWQIIKALCQELNKDPTMRICIQIVSIEMETPNRERARLEAIIAQEKADAYVITTACLPEILESWGVQELPVFRINNVTVWEGENPPTNIVNSWFCCPPLSQNDVDDGLSTGMEDDTIDDSYDHDDSDLISSSTILPNDGSEVIVNDSQNGIANKQYDAGKLLQLAYSALYALLDAGHDCLTESDRILLAKKAEQITENDKPRIASILQASYRGFFVCAAKGNTFVPVDQIQSKYGKTLEENYPGASQAFLRFAYSYWTLKCLALALAADEDHERSGIQQLILKIERELGSIFFPTPGPIRMSTKAREKAQRKVLSEWKAPIAIEEFIKGNPILNAAPRGKGYGTIVATIVICLMIVFMVIYFF